nr:MAG TPA: hypothetical protein [Caudoviricetes sp.]
MYIAWFTTREKSPYELFWSPLPLAGWYRIIIG